MSCFYSFSVFFSLQASSSSSLSLSAELQLYVVHHVVHHVVMSYIIAAAEVFSRIVRDNEVFYFLESSFFLRPSFLLARSQLGCQPSSILDLVAPSPHRIDSQFFPVFLQSTPPFTFPSSTSRTILFHERSSSPLLAQ